VKATRRAAVTAYGAAALTLTACTADRPGATSAATGPGVSTATGAGSTDPDRAALDRATALTVTMLAEAQGAGPRADPGGRLAELHRAHLAALQTADQAASEEPSPLPHTAGRSTPARLRRHEVRTQRELARLAEQASSGPLARLFASMSAGVAAHLAALPPEVPR